MFRYKTLMVVLVVLGTALFCVAGGSSQQAPSAGSPTYRSVQLNVVVTTASGQWVTDLEQKDFVIFDNNSARPITSFDVVLISPTDQKNAPILKSASQAHNTGAEDRGERFYYAITFDSAVAERPDEYHRIEVKVKRPKLTIRSRQGYFAQP
jgi:hypothetical protein